MSRFDFLKDVDNNLYNLCLQVEEKQNDDIDVFMLKCRRVLEYLVNLAGCEGKNLNDKIWDIPNKIYISNALKYELVFLKGLCNENIHLDNQSANNVNKTRVIDILENACHLIIKHTYETSFLYEHKIKDAEEVQRLLNTKESKKQHQPLAREEGRIREEYYRHSYIETKESKHLSKLQKAKEIEYQLEVRKNEFWKKFKEEDSAKRKYEDEKSKIEELHRRDKEIKDLENQRLAEEWLKAREIEKEEYRRYMEEYNRSEQQRLAKEAENKRIQEEKQKISYRLFAQSAKLLRTIYNKIKK